MVGTHFTVNPVIAVVRAIDVSVLNMSKTDRYFTNEVCVVGFDHATTFQTNDPVL